MEDVKTTTLDVEIPWTDRETAAYMKLSPKCGYITVQRWAREGILRGGKVGDHWRFWKRDVDDFIFAKK